MSDRMTEIYLPGMRGAGFADYGRKTIPEMLATIREQAIRMKAVADALLAAADADFCVSTYVGIYAQRNRTILQCGKKP